MSVAVSQQKDLLELWQRVLEELGTWCSTCTTQDYNTVLRRVEREGLSFLTITLANFGKDLQKGLDQGFVGSDHFAGFKRRGGLPLFLGGFLCRVFDSGTGVLLDAPDVDSIFALRQLTLMFAKILVDCSENRTRGAIDSYIECEKEVKEHDQSTSSTEIQEFRDMAALLFTEVFTGMDSDVYYNRLLPRHGPGNTADRQTGNGKFDQRTWPERLERVFPFGEYARVGYDEYLYNHVELLEPGAEIPVRVITVPKTLKTPRVIALEPTAMQYMQQAIAKPLVEYLEHDNIVRGMIGFVRQEPNQLLAKEGSIFGQLATLDLSEASDRVSNQHVRWLVPETFPHFKESVESTRSRKADVPRHGVIRLAKFASMGSALCFPVEAMVFLTMIFLGIQDGHRHRLTPRDVKSFRGQVRVYGDDIIVPVDYVQFVCNRLTAFGLRVNVDKSYWNGKFRESCGKDYYNGHDVTPIRVRRVIPTRRTDVLEIISMISLRNQLYQVGLWRTVEWLDEKICRLIRYFPIVDPTSPVLGRHSFLSWKAEAADVDLQAPLVKGWTVHSKPPVSPVSGEGALLKCLLRLETKTSMDEPSVDSEHLERSGRPDAVYIKLRYASPF